MQYDRTMEKNSRISVSAQTRSERTGNTMDEIHAWDQQDLTIHVPDRSDNNNYKGTDLKLRTKLTMLLAAFSEA